MFNPSALFQAATQLMQNPAQIFQRMNINIPQNMMRDPNAIAQYLMSSGRFSQQQYDQARQMAERFRPR